MSDVVGIISTCRSSDLLMGLTKERPIAAVPFGGRYRLLDFPLSNMVNSGIRTVGIIVPYNCRPVLDHLKMGKGWSLDRKIGGLFILPSDDLQVSNEGFQLRDLAMNIDFLKKATADQVILACSNMVFNTRYTDALRFHQKSGADVTLIYKAGEALSADNGDSLSLELGTQGRVLGLTSGTALRGENKGGRFLDTVIIKRRLLLRLIEEFDTVETMDLLTAVGKNLEKLKVNSYPFKGYIGRINSVESYFRCSMGLLNPEVRKELFYNIHTKIADTPPSRYGVSARVKNSLIAGGCRIDGRVENSIVFRDVYIGQGAFVNNSIIMQKCFVGGDVRLENVILDKFVRVKRGVTIKREKYDPVIVEKRVKLKFKGVVL